MNTTIKNFFTLTVDQFNAFLLNKVLFYLKNKYLKRDSSVFLFIYYDFYISNR